jgi:hypothetical protein
MTYGQHGTNLPNSHVPGILARRAREGAQVCGCMVANVWQRSRHARGTLARPRCCGGPFLISHGPRRQCYDRREEKRQQKSKRKLYRGEAGATEDDGGGSRRTLFAQWIT